MITASDLRNIASFCLNTNRWDLEAVGIIAEGPSGDTAWKRFNNDFDVFVTKLPEAKLEVLTGMINEARQ